MSKPEYVTSPDGTSIAYQTIGSGPGLVVLSGAVLHADAYAKLSKILGRSFAVHVVHRRGRGLSGPQGSSYSIEKECDDVISVLDATQSHRLFGHSFGALLALETARRAPAGLDRVVAYDPAFTFDKHELADFLPEFADAVARRHYGRALTSIQRGLHVGGRLDRLPKSAAICANWLLTATVSRAIRPILPTVIAEVAAAFTPATAPEAFRTIRADTLVLVGEHSPPWLKDHGAAVVSAAASARLLTMPGLDHNGPLLRPRQLAAVSTPFLLGKEPTCT
jgi:pimeloyl-ACP methyl ester carboxylesterase